MFQFKPNEFVNCDGRRVFDDAGRQGIDGVTGLGSSTEVLCGQILEILYKHSPHLAEFQIDDIIGWCRQIRDGVTYGEPRRYPVTP